MAGLNAFRFAGRFNVMIVSAGSWSNLMVFGIKSPGGYYEWLTGYLSVQHGIDQDPVSNPIKAGFGIFSTFVQSEPLKDWLDRTFTWQGLAT